MACRSRLTAMRFNPAVSAYASGFVAGLVIDANYRELSTANPPAGCAKSNFLAQSVPAKLGPNLETTISAALS